MLKELDATAYEQIIQDGKTAVVEFYSATCPHCKRTEAGFQSLISEMDEKQAEAVLFGKCNIASVPTLRNRLEIQTVPTLLFIKNGQIINRKTGFTHKLVLQEEIRKLTQ